jgi:hypothetical protein
VSDPASNFLPPYVQPAQTYSSFPAWTVLTDVVIFLPAAEVAALAALGMVPGGVAGLPAARTAVAAATVAAVDGSLADYSALAAALDHPCLQGVSLLLGAQLSPVPLCFPDADLASYPTEQQLAGAVSLLAAAYQGWGAAGRRVCFAVKTSEAVQGSQLISRVMRAASALLHPPPPTVDSVESAVHSSASGQGHRDLALGLGLGLGLAAALVSSVVLVMMWHRKRSNQPPEGYGAGSHQITASQQPGTRPQVHAAHGAS